MDHFEVFRSFFTYYILPDASLQLELHKYTRTVSPHHPGCTALAQPHRHHEVQDDLYWIECILISSIFESYPGLCLGHSVSHSLCPQFFLPNERENILVSSVCGSVGIKYSSQILQSCSKLGGSFRHSVSF